MIKCKWQSPAAVGILIGAKGDKGDSIIQQQSPYKEEVEAHGWINKTLNFKTEDSFSLDHPLTSHPNLTYIILTQTTMFLKP